MILITAHVEKKFSITASVEEMRERERRGRLGLHRIHKGCRVTATAGGGLCAVSSSKTLHKSSLKMAVVGWWELN